MDPNNKKMNSLSIRIGFWSTLLFTLSGVTYGTSASIFFSLYPIPVWSNIHDFASYMSSSPQRLFGLCQAMAFLSGPFFILMMCSIYDFAGEEKRILARIGICFGIVFVTLASMCYFVQFTVLPQNILSGQLDGLNHFVQLNTKSFISAIVILGWGLFFGLATLSIAPIFNRGKLEKLIRWSFILTGVFCILNTIGFMLQNVMLSIGCTLMFNMSMIVACICICILFKKLCTLRNN